MWTVVKSFFAQAWFGSVIGIIGFLVGYIFYRTSRIGPRPVYQLRALRLIAEDEETLPEEVEILFRDKSVPRLTKTHVILWNSGNATLHGRNIAQTDPLRLEFSKDAQVLRVRLLKATRGANKFKVRINLKSPNELLCSFDYLDRADGATIELLHTDKERYPKVLGAIRGIPKGVLNWGPISSSIDRFVLVILAAVGAGMFAATAVISRLILRISQSPLPQYLLATLYAVPLAYVAVIIVRWWPARRRSPKSLTIEDIEG